MSDVWLYFWLCISAFAAGAINALAGGGTLLTFPALVWALRSGPDPEAIANITSTIALVPGSAAGAWGYRRELQGARPWLLLLLGPSLVGGVVGSVLLILLPGSVFAVVIPWLLLTAALLFLAQPRLMRWLPAKGESTLPSPWLCAVVVGFQFLVSVYGGYFGAGIGILMLSALGLMGLHDIHRMNAVKTVLAAVINGVSVIVFVYDGRVVWRYGLTMAIAAIAGGFAGAHYGRRLPRWLVRWTVIVLGFGLAAYYFWK